MSETIDNLQEAFAGESQAFQKYTAFAAKAKSDGFPNVSKLLKQPLWPSNCMLPGTSKQWTVWAIRSKT